LAEAHGVMATAMLRLDWDWLGAEREYRRAIELNPSLVDSGHNEYAIYLSFRGRHDEAIREIELAHELDPLAMLPNISAGMIYMRARQYDRAIEQFRNVLDLNSKNAGARIWLGQAYVHKAMYQEALAEIQKAIDITEGNSISKAHLAWAYAMAGRKSEAVKIIGELKDFPNQEPVLMAAVYAALGEMDRAFMSLETAHEKRDQLLLALKVEQAFDSLRSDPRYAELLRRVGFPQ
jgi:adenylate cyclase